MFQYLRDKPRILVTGLMRSGTTICSEMIAHDTGHKPFREEILERVKPEELPRPLVLQAPVLLKAALEYKAKGWHVVVMLREFKDCVDSTKRMLKDKYPKHLDPKLVDLLMKNQEFLRILIDSDMSPMVVRYEDLRLHPLWVENRQGWDFRQTKSGPIYSAEMGLS